MPSYDIFSKRQKKLRQETPDVYIYDKIPEPLRVQVVHIWKDAFGNIHAYESQAGHVYKQIYKTLCREYGIFHLNDKHELRNGTLSEYLSALSNFFVSAQEAEKALDVIELSFQCIDFYTRDNGYRYHSTPSITADDAIEELNLRFLEHGVGYKYEAGTLIRIDSELVHAEVVKPTLNLLRAKEYKGANEEFLKAHGHYRHQRYQECMNECLKAFESVMKAICHKRKWQYNQKDTAKVLIDICFKKGLIPNFLESHFTALRSCLESGVPTVRNKLSGHGQGVQPKAVPAYMAGYLLHLTATSILLMVEAEKQLP
jgi:Domain of unknown function (DUF7014)/AbiJ N-terminal domain 4